MAAGARRFVGLLVAVCSLSTGCAGLTGTTSGATRASLAYEPGRELRELPVFASATALEREHPPASDAPTRQPTKALFWTGVVLGSIGTAATAGFGIAGRVVENDLHDGYASGFSAAEADDLRDRGSTYNKLAITSAVIGVVGWATALIVYGIDYTRCGPLVVDRHKRDCPR